MSQATGGGMGVPTVRERPATRGPLTPEELYEGLEATGRRRPDAQQSAAVAAPADESLYIVAGPGTGKTTALVIRILKLMLVDGVVPGAILATTFTKKAA